MVENTYCIIITVFLASGTIFRPLYPILRVPIIWRNEQLAYNQYNLLFAVVSQAYSVHLVEENVLRGNAAIIKCLIPSFVTEYVSVSSWIMSEGEVETEIKLNDTVNKEGILYLLRRSFFNPKYIQSIYFMFPSISSFSRLCLRFDLQ